MHDLIMHKPTRELLANNATFLYLFTHIYTNRTISKREIALQLHTCNSICAILTLSINDMLIKDWYIFFFLFSYKRWQVLSTPRHPRPPVPPVSSFNNKINKLVINKLNVFDFLWSIVTIDNSDHQKNDECNVTCILIMHNQSSYSCRLN